MCVFEIMWFVEFVHMFHKHCCSSGQFVGCAIQTFYSFFKIEFLIYWRKEVLKFLILIVQVLTFPYIKILLSIVCGYKQESTFKNLYFWMFYFLNKCFPFRNKILFLESSIESYIKVVSLYSMINCSFSKINAFLPKVHLLVMDF